MRSFQRDKKYSILNIIGLAVGITSFLLISLYLKSELEYDQFHKDSDKIYRVLYHSKTPTNDIVWARTGPGMLPALRQSLPNVMAGSRILAGKNVLDPDPLVKNGTIQFLEPRLFYADSEFFEVFTFTTLDGNPIDFSDPYSIVMTESTATKYFGEHNPLGETLEIPGRGNYTVKQVIRDLPVNSHFHFDLVANIQSHNIHDNDAWSWTRVYTYLKLNDTRNVDQTQQLMQAALEKNFSVRTFSGASYEEWKKSGNEVKLLMQPLESIHLNSTSASEFEPGGDIKYVKLFLIVAVLVLMLSCINFINLYTSQSLKVARDVSVQKTFGASREQLFARFILQSILTTFAATVLAVGLTILVFPMLNTLMGNSIADTSPHWSWGVIAFGFAVLIGFLAGIYPALYLSRFEPLQVLRQKYQNSGKGLTIRNVLIVFQFCISVGLVIATLTIYNQVNYMQKKDLGFKKNLVVLERANVLDSKTKAFKEALKNSPLVEEVSSSSTVPGSWIGSVSLYPLGGSVADRVIVYPIFTDFRFDETFDFEFVQGRGFSEDFTSDSLAVIINETALKAFGMEDIEGESLKGWLSAPHPIVGVVKDFNQNSPKAAVEPMVIFSNFFPSMQNISIRLSDNKRPEASMSCIQETWNQFAPSEPMIYFYLDQNFDKLYKNEIETGNLFSALTFVAVLIAALGLFGLTTFAVENRGKEFAIRKVLGADAIAILSVMLREFSRLVLISFVIAIPIAWILMNNWLESFAYRTAIPIWVLLLSGTVMLVITLIVTVGKSLQSAFENPVKRLRNE